MRLPLIIFLSCLSSCFSPSLGAHTVKGKLYDAETLLPIKGVEVQLKITKPFLQEIVKTNQEGDFSIEYSGDVVPLPDLFLEQSDLQQAERTIKVNFTHPEFVSDVYEEQRQCMPAVPAVFDVGAFYLQRKEEFLNKKVASID
jgi:hypothetical protein